jgi:diguanylate cyclase (GGDEF)-like protein
MSGHDDTPPTAAALLRRLQEIADLRPDGPVRVELVRDADGRVIGVEPVHDDRNALLRELGRHARYEALTAALDPATLRAQHRAGDERRSGTTTAVCFCDIDHFTEVNASYGHDAGNEVLRVTAERLRDGVRDGDRVIHIGDDEIVVVLTGVHGHDDAVAIAEMLRAATARPVDTLSGRVEPTASIGVTLVDDGETADAVIGRVDEALQRAKRGGRDQVVFVAI